MRAPRLTQVGLCSCLSLAAAPAHPDTAIDPAPEARPGRLNADIGAGSVFPLYVGAQAFLEGPQGLQLQLEAGWMPTAYAHAIDGTLQLFHVYPPEVSQLIREALDSSLVLRSSMGWRPFAAYGLELAAGYTYLTLGGGLGPREVIESVTGRDMPNETRHQIPLHSTLHNLHARVAWRFAIGERWALRAWLEYLHCFASSSGIDYQARRRAGERAADGLNAAIDDYLNGYYTGYVHVPMLGVTAAYRL